MPKKEILEPEADEATESVPADVTSTGTSESESEAKKAYRAHLEVYKKQNPEKYEAKKEAFEAKLNSL